MTISVFIQLVFALLKLPEEIRALILLFSKAPEEKKQEMSKQVILWMNQSSSGSRPKWDE